jgi:hypothetical protein
MGSMAEIKISMGQDQPYATAYDMVTVSNPSRSKI